MRVGMLPQSDRKYCDQLIRKHCLQDGMHKVRAAYVYRTLRIFGSFAAKQQVEKSHKVLMAP